MAALTGPGTLAALQRRAQRRHHPQSAQSAARLPSLHRDRVDWSKVDFFWGDERCVPATDPLSNYRMADETLLARVPVSQSQIHRFPTELEDPDLIAARYEEDMREAFGLVNGEIPRFDLVYLGMGPDGHTASLFPHTRALSVTDHWYRPTMCLSSKLSESH